MSKSKATKRDAVEALVEARDVLRRAAYSLRADVAPEFHNFIAEDLEAAAHTIEVVAGDARLNGL